MIKTKAYAAQSASTALAPFSIERRDPGPHDIQLEILYCGVCHSDLHTVRNEWRNTLYPSVPGHEIVGRVVAVGSQVRGFKAGELAGVGCLVDSCGHCPSCGEGLEQYCENGFVGTYNGPAFGGENTYGGYSQTIVVKKSFVLKIRHDEKQLAAVAPLLCAGITTYSPLRHWKAGPGKTVGIVGLGGLGHMGVKIARAMGARVVLFTTSPAKTDDALRLGAHEVCISTDPAQMARLANKLDLIVDTVAASHSLLVTRGKLRAAAHRCADGIGDFNLVLAESRKPERDALFGRAFCRKQLGDSTGARADIERYRREFPLDPRLPELERRLGTTP